jgi:hypothetical protein
MPQFTLVASTTQLWRVDERLRRWFVPYEFGPYTPADIAVILVALGREHGLTITNDAAQELAPHCKGTPGNALVLVRRLATECVDLVRPELASSSALKALALLGYGQSYPQSLRLIDQLTSMSGIEFEQWVANLFRAAGWDTEQTPVTGDHGIDLIVHKRGATSVVQCKRWLDPVGEAVVRDMYGALMSFGARHGFVIAPTSFTEQACKFAAGKPISLIEIEELIAWSKQPDSFNPEG